MTRAEVVFCGNSLYLDSLATGLQTGGRIRVFRLESSIRPLVEALKMLHPDGVIFELEQYQFELLVSDFITAFPLIRFIGIHPDGETMTVFSLTGNRLIPVADLERAILETASE